MIRCDLEPFNASESNSISLKYLGNCECSFSSFRSLLLPVFIGEG